MFSILLVVGPFMLGFIVSRFFKRKTDNEPFSEKRILHGHNLDKYHYLGYVTLKVDGQAHHTFLFCDKDDFNNRSYTVTGPQKEYVEKHHNYVNACLKPWTFGEYNLYSLRQEYRSDWLNTYMLEEFGCEWSKEKNWWVTTEQAKYIQAQKQQEKKSEDNVAVTKENGSNVITVEFGKQS